MLIISSIVSNRSHEWFFDNASSFHTTPYKSYFPCLDTYVSETISIGDDDVC